MSRSSGDPLSERFVGAHFMVVMVSFSSSGSALPLDRPGPRLAGGFDFERRFV
jgi:hypothetical protein